MPPPYSLHLAIVGSPFACSFKDGADVSGNTMRGALVVDALKAELLELNRVVRHMKKGLGTKTSTEDVGPLLTIMQVRVCSVVL